MDTTPATAGISVERAERRKALTTSTTSTREISKVNSISCNEVRIDCVRSDETRMSMSGGSSARSSGSMALISSTTSITFAPGWRLTKASTAGSPLIRPMPLISSTL